MPEHDGKPFAEFDRKLREARRDGPKDTASTPVERGSAGPGVQAGLEVFGGVVAGLLLGWALDSWLGTGPFLLILFLFLGGAAGLRNAYRTLKRLVQDEDAG